MTRACVSGTVYGKCVKKHCDPEVLRKRWKNKQNHRFRRVKKTLCLHGFSKPLENVVKMKVFIVVKKPIEEEVVREPVQVGRRTKENLRKINDFLAVAHVPIVSPLARDLVLHGFRKPWKTIGEYAFLARRLSAPTVKKKINLEVSPKP